MPSHTARLAAASALAITLLLSGCAAGATTSSGDDDTSTSAETGSDDTGSTASGCAAYADETDPALALFTTSLITSGPSEGQTYGDGTELSVTLSDEAMAAGLLPQFELNALDGNGSWVQLASLIFDPTTGDDGTFSTSSLEFGNDDYVDKAVVAQIFAIHDGAVGDAETYGDKLLLGNYCLTYANDES
jgi:hypothetical protein